MTDLPILDLDAAAPGPTQPFSGLSLRLSAVRGLRCEIRNLNEPEIGYAINGDVHILPTPHAQRRSFRFTNSGPLVTPPPLGTFAIGQRVSISSSPIFVAGGAQGIVVGYDLSWNATNGDGGWMLDLVEVSR